MTSNAWDVPETRDALHRHRLRSLATACVGVGAWIVAAGVGGTFGFPDNGPLSWVLMGLLGLGLVPLVGGLMALVNTLRIKHTLRLHPWVPYKAAYREIAMGTPNGNPTLYLGEHQEHALTLVAFNWRWSIVQGVSPIWFAGDPERGGVASPPGDLNLIWCRRPVSGRWRRKIQWSPRAE